MANSIANLILQIISQKGGASSDVDELAASLEALDHTKAEATAQVNTDKGAFDELQTQLDLFDHKTVKAKATVDIAEGEAQLQLFSHSLDNLQSKSFKGQFFSAGDIGSFTQLFSHLGQLSIPVDLDSKGAEAHAVELHEQLKLELGEETVKVDTDTTSFTKVKEAVSALGDAFSSLAQEGGGIGNVFEGFGGDLSKVTVNLGAFGFRLGPVLAGVLALATAIGISLVSALIAVVSSAVLAATALGALGVALAGALGPIAAIAIPAALLFGKALTALTSNQAANTAATRANTQAQQQAIQAQTDARNFAEQRASAEQSLAQAVQNATQARAAAYREEQDAIQAVTDAVNGLRDAQLSQAQASLNLDKAKQALKDFRDQLGLTGKAYDAMFKTFTDVAFDPAKLNDALAKVKAPAGSQLNADQQLQLKQLILDIATAKQGEADATNQVTHAETTLNRARQDAQPFIQQGINGSKQYQAALQGVAQAQQNLTKLESDHAFQLQQTAKLNALNAASLQATASGTSKLSGEELKIYNVLKQLKGAFETAFGPAVNALLDGLLGGLKLLGPLMTSLQGPMLQLGKAMGTAVFDFFKGTTASDTQKVFQAMINGAIKLVPLINQIFQPMLDILGKIATAAMPFLVQGFANIAKFMNQLNNGLTVKNISDFIAKLIPNLNAWVNLALQLVPSFFKYMIAVAPYGIQFLKWVTGVAVAFGQWAASAQGRKQIQDFFSTAIPAAITFFEALAKIIGFFAGIPAWIYEAVGALVALVAILLTASAVVGALATAGEILLGVLAFLISPIGLVVAALAALVVGFVIAYNKLGFFKNAVDDITSWIANAFNNVIKFMERLPATLYKLAVDAGNAIWNGIRSVGLDIAGWIVPKFNAVISFLSTLPNRFFSWGSRIINGLWDGIKSIGLDVATWVAQKFNAALNWLSGIVNWFVNAGKAIVEGIWKGIKSVPSDIVGWAKNTFVNPVKNLLGIGSPSKLFEEYGKSIGQGFQVGIDATTHIVQDAAMRTVAAPIGAAMGVSGGGGGGITIQNQNVNLPPAPGHDQMGDPRVQAAQFAREMRRRGWR